MDLQLRSERIIKLTETDNTLQHAAGHICRLCEKQLPDLSTVTVLTPALQIVPALHSALVSAAEEHGHPALLTPRVMTLRQFTAAHADTVSQHVITENERLLILLSELRHHKRLFGEGNPWLLAEDLLRLFDELLLNQVQLPATENEFYAQLAEAYRLPRDNPFLQREARLVLTLWQAWQQQLHNEQLLDPTQLYLRQLGSSLTRVDPNTTIFVLGVLDISNAETEWLNKLVAITTCYLFHSGSGESGQTLPETGLSATVKTADATFSAFLNTCYDWQQQPLRYRINEFRQHAPQSPAAGRLHCLGVDRFEQQAQAATLFIRAAIADGSQRIGIICEDRLLARRIRSLLERNDIVMHDAVGWALSTTRAAAVLESWLECIELDFPQQAFLDLLKSPLLLESENDALLKVIYRFENDIVLHERKGAGLDSYRKATHSRSKRLGNRADRTRRDLLDLLQHFQVAAQPLLSLRQNSFDPQHALELILASLQHLSRTTFLQDDAAADQILQTLLSLQHAARQQTTHMDWYELRDWVSRALETEYFQSETENDHRVVLLGLQQSYLQTFDTLVVAAADEQHLPGDNGALPFFNDSVRAALGLPDRFRQRRIKEILFKNLLAGSREILLLWQKQIDGEPVSASHWVSALQVFHEQVYGDPLEPQTINQWLKQTDSVPGRTDTSVPVDIAQQPRPLIGPLALPEKISAGAHQRLINCPYQFYVQDILRLKPLDEVRETLQKSDYGNLVHRCLQAFHTGIDKIPGPFQQPLNNATRKDAVEMLENISRHIFFTDVENNFQHRAWLLRWLEFIPRYIDWQSMHAAEWQISAGEKNAETGLTEEFMLYGRIDRIEKQVDRFNLVDYKTGAVPGQEDIASGEDVQLVSYSLLLDHVDSVQYLGVDGRTGVNDKSSIGGEELMALQQAVKSRLVDLLQRIRNNEPMPAHGDDKTCAWCDAAGICRKAAWK